MKKKILVMLPILSTFLLSGCQMNLFGKKININLPWEEKQSESKETDDGSSSGPIDDIDPGEAKTHATSISQTPNAPFYLKVNESRQISVSLSPAPTEAFEKTFTWKLTGDSISYVVDESSTNKATVTGVKEGTATLEAVNDFNYTLTKTFTIKVINFSEDYDYLWQYQSSDREQFGYVNETGKKAGFTEGDAILGGMTWHYTRSEATSLQSSMGSIGFGKGGEPEKHVHLETENVREVKNITIEAASANSLAKMTVKVGETLFMNEKEVLRPSYDTVGTLNSENSEFATGKIEIDVITPAVDKDQLENPDYKVPGAFYLKSILINFNEGIPPVNISLVKDSEDLVSGNRYLIVGNVATENGLPCLDGDLGSGVKDNPLFMKDFALNDSVEVSGDFSKHGFVLTLDEDNKAYFKSDKGIQIGLANGGGLSTTKDPDLVGWTYTFEEGGSIDFKMTDPKDAAKEKHFGANSSSGKFSAYAKSQKNIFLYKF